MHFSLALAALVGSARSAILWDGRFNEFTSSTDLNNWSWSNQVGPYQYYIHGPSPVQSYVNLSPSYKNPADTGSRQGVKITLDNTAYWNGQNMRRTELIPQTRAPITSGLVYYHFSISKRDINPPSVYREHQICFFESHFTELKSGLNSGAPGGSDNTLRFAIQGQTKWSVDWEAGVWHNFAFAINFSANTVALYHSTGSAALTLKVPAISVSTSSNGADWHLGVLELPVSGRADTDEDYYFSGVYIESGSLSTSPAGPDGPPNSVSSSAPPSTLSTVRTSTTTSIRSSTSTTRTVNLSTTGPSSTTTTRRTTSVTTSSTRSVNLSTTGPSSTTTRRTTSSTTATSSAVPTGGGTLPKYSQCAGIGWPGSGTCVAGTTCVYSNPYYSQCL